MSFDVDRSGLLREAEMTGEGLLIVFHARGQSDSFDLLVEAIATANSQSCALDDRAAAGPLVAAPVGWVTWMDICDSSAAFELWLDDLARFLSRSDWHGALGPVARERHRYDDPRNLVDGMSGGIVLRSDLLQNPAGTERTAWGVDAHLTDTILSRLLEHLAEHDGVAFLSQGRAQFTIDRQQLRTHVEAGLRRRGDLAVTVLDGGAWLVRLAFGPQGRFHLELPNVEGTWHQPVDRLLHLLRDLADISEYGLVRKTWSPGTTWRTLVANRAPDPPYVSGTYYYGARGIEDEKVPDAYGIQLLTDRHIAVAGALNEWNIELLGGVHLVVAQDLSAWFGADAPTTTTVAEARAAFGDLLMNGRDIAAASP